MVCKKHVPLIPRGSNRHVTIRGVRTDPLCSACEEEKEHHCTF